MVIKRISISIEDKDLEDLDEFLDRFNRRKYGKEKSNRSKFMVDVTKSFMASYQNKHKES